MAPVLPAECPSCGLRYQPTSGGIRIGGTSFGNIFADNTTTCPRCRGGARIIEGTLNTRDGAIELVSGPQWSQDLIDALRLNLQRIVDENPPDPIAAVRERVDHELAQQIADAVAAGLSATGLPNTQRRRRQLTKKVLVGLLAIVGFSYADAAHNLAWVASHAEHLFQHVAAHGDVPEPPR